MLCSATRPMTPTRSGPRLEGTRDQAGDPANPIVRRQSATTGGFTAAATASSGRSATSRSIAPSPPDTINSRQLPRHAIHRLGPILDQIYRCGIVRLVIMGWWSSVPTFLSGRDAHGTASSIDSIAAGLVWRGVRADVARLGDRTRRKTARWHDCHHGARGRGRARREVRWTEARRGRRTGGGIPEPGCLSTKLRQG